jgi:hypothetical protein
MPKARKTLGTALFLWWGWELLLNLNVKQIYIDGAYFL